MLLLLLLLLADGTVVVLKDGTLQHRKHRNQDLMRGKAADVPSCGCHGVQERACNPLVAVSGACMSGTPPAAVTALRRHARLGQIFSSS